MAHPRKNSETCLQNIEVTLETFWKISTSGRFPFTKKFRKFRLGCKWNMIFRFVPLENFREKMELLKRQYRFSGWKFSDGTASTIYGFAKVFTSSRPLSTISSVRKYGGYTERITSESAMNHTNAKTYQGELEALQTRVVEELFLWLVPLGTEFQRSPESSSWSGF